MATIITYVCDVSGVSGTDKLDFVEVQVTSVSFIRYGSGNIGNQSHSLDKRIVHKDVAKRLGLLPPPKPPEEAPAEVTFESKLVALLKDWAGELVQEHLDNQ